MTRLGRRLGPMVELLIRDIASPDPADPMFPRLRCFDTYAGTRGLGQRGLRRRQQPGVVQRVDERVVMASCSGGPHGNEALRDLAFSLYNTERTAIESIGSMSRARITRRIFPMSRSAWSGEARELRHLVFRRDRLHPWHQLAAVHARLALHGSIPRLRESEP